MSVIVGTCVWSQALRGDPRNQVISAALAKLIQQGQVLMLGPIRQEILSAYKDPQRFATVEKHLASSLICQSYQTITLLRHNFIIGVAAKAYKVAISTF